VDTEGIRASVESAVAYLTEHPDEAAYTDSPAGARIEEGLRVRVTGPGQSSTVTDMPTSVGGGDAAPSPGWLLRAAIASCVCTLIALRSAQRSVALQDLEVTVDSESDDRGILGIDEGVPAGPLTVRVVVRVVADDIDPGALVDLANWAVAHCPVSDAVTRAVPLDVEIRT